MSASVGLDRAHDRREIGGLRRRRIGLVVNDLVAALLGVGAGAFAGVLREFGVRVAQRHRLRLRLLRGRDLEEAFGERALGVLPGRQHREVFRVIELGVHVERKQADEGLALADHDRHRGRDVVGGVGREHEIDFVDVEQLGVDAGDFSRRALVVVIDELDRTAEQAAGLVGALFPDLHAEQRLLAVRRQEAGQRHGEADLDRLLVSARWPN